MMKKFLCFLGIFFLGNFEWGDRLSGCGFSVSLFFGVSVNSFSLGHTDVTDRPMGTMRPSLSFPIGQERKIMMNNDERK